VGWSGRSARDDRCGLRAIRIWFVDTDLSLKGLIHHIENKERQIVLNSNSTSPRNELQRQTLLRLRSTIVRIGLRVTD